MSENPILFSGPMVRAILDGAKTQTRRLVAPSSSTLGSGEWDGLPLGTAWVDNGSAANFFCPVDRCQYLHAGVHRVYPRIEPGDTLWVRETWCASSSLDGLSPSLMSESTPVAYLADSVTRGDWSVIAPGRTRVSIHMPRWASRLSLRVTDVRVERLGDISEADARAEGLRLHAAGWTDGVNGYDTLCARDAFAELWVTVHGDGAWERDRERWVWVYTFEVCR